MMPSTSTVSYRGRAEPVRASSPMPAGNELSLLEVQEGERAYEAADAVVSDFSAIYGQGIMDRAADILRNCCLTAQEAGLSIVEIPMILADEWFRAAVIESLQDHDLQNFWA